MPELPEVENLRLGLVHVIVGQKIREVKVRKPKLVSGKGTLRVASQRKKGEFLKGLKGEYFIGVERRAKNLIFVLSKGKIILAHLKMSGQFVYQASDNKKSVMGGHPIELSETKLPNYLKMRIISNYLVWSHYHLNLIQNILEVSSRKRKVK